MVMPVRKQPSAVPSGHTGPPTTTAAAAPSPSLPAPSLLETDFRSSSISKVHDWSLEVEEEEEWNNQRRRMSESSEQVWPLLASRSVSMFSRTTRLRILEKLFFTKLRCFWIAYPSINMTTAQRPQSWGYSGIASLNTRYVILNYLSYRIQNQEQT